MPRRCSNCKSQAEEIKGLNEVVAIGGAKLFEYEGIIDNLIRKIKSQEHYIYRLEVELGKISKEEVEDDTDE